MWSPIVLLFLAGFACATTNPGWKDNAEYVYRVRGRTLASLHEVSDQYSGILLKAVLRVQPRSDGRLQGQISEAQYSQIHSNLWNGWNTFIPDAELSWKSLEMSSKPFQIEMKNGVITDLVVSKEIPNWEANIIKSIVSQLQLNTSFDEQDVRTNSAMFLTMEDTVTGNTETLYRINPLPEYILQSDPLGQKILEQKGDGEVIEVVKHKNYTNSVELPSYFYGFEGLQTGYPASNKMGKFFVRDSTSRAILTGSLKRFTIQNSYTISEVMVNPTLADNQKGSVYSSMNITLSGVKSQNEKIEDVPNPLRLGNLVYTYEQSSSDSNLVQEKENYYQTGSGVRVSPKFSRSIMRMRRSLLEGDRDQELYDSEESYKQEHPHINEAPRSPLLPYTMGYKGMSIRKAVDIVKTVTQLANEIGNDLQEADRVLTENTLNKFTTLAALLKVTKYDEIQSITQQLYTESTEGPKSDAWKVFRDAVAESGTGPAFLAIKNWIETKKIQGAEASLILTAMSRSVRQPTPQYVKSFFELVKSHEVQSEWPLNNTALLSFSEFVRKLYVSEDARKQFPIKSFNNFVNDESEQFLKETILPYFSQQLERAVSNAETHKIHVYIRVLGNIAHPYILQAFKPYFEGEKQASQYQRLLMVLSLDKLAEHYPEEAQSVLFKIYQNAGETQEVRVAAVYQLMRTHPQAEMLQLMASYTKIDKHEHVNAAVKSAIESAAELEGPEYYYFRLSALSAKPLLTKKVYGVQHGIYHLRRRFIDELNVNYKQIVQTLGDEESFYPKGLKYSLRYFFGGKNIKLVDVQTWVSNVDELVHVLQQQTEKYSQKQQQQSQNFDQQKQQQWSSQRIASLLKIKPEEIEQLEGSLYAEMASPLGMISFDNMTLHRLPEAIRKFENELENGKKFNFVKMMNAREMALSFPTDMGLPFLFTYDTPILVKVEGKLKGSASPKISDGNKLRKPERIQITSDFKVTVTTKVQSHLSFITPFDHQQYIAGFDKHFQINVPVQGNLEIDVNNMETKFEWQLDQNKQEKLLHYSTWPYTSRMDITNFQPVANQPNTHIIKQDNLHGWDKTFGKQQTGLAMRVQVQHERDFVDYFFLQDLFYKHGLEAAVMGLWKDANIQYSQINVNYLPQESSTRRIVLRVNHKNEYRNEANQERKFSYNEEPSQRLQSMIESVSSKINNVLASAYDAEIEFQGDRSVKITATGGYGKSNVDPQSRIMFYLKKHSDESEIKPFFLNFALQNEVPNTNGLDLHYALQSEPQMQSEWKLSYGQSEESATKIKSQMEFRRSEERKQYLKQLPNFHQCQNEMQKGDNQLPSCVNVTMEANLLNHVRGMVNFENLKPETKEFIQTLYSALKFKYMPTIDTDRQQKSESNEIRFEGKLDADLRAVNVSVITKDGQTTIKNIPVGQYAKEIIVPHPVFHLRSRLASKALELDSYRPFCVVDQTMASTFNNKTFPAEISKHWTVMLQYLPKEARHGHQKDSIEQQLKYQVENYMVLVRQNPSSSQQKDIKITLSTPETEFKVVEITMTPSGSSQQLAKVTVDGQQVSFSDRRAFDWKQGYIQIYALPNGEVKFEVRNGFYVIYDGKRARLTVADCKFRNAVRGICGQFNDEQVEDFLAPSHCIVRDHEKFIRSYEIEGQEGEQVRQQLREDRQQCAHIEVPLYVSVISEQQDASYDSGFMRRSSSGRRSTHMQTRYIEKDGEICFTSAPMPVCPGNARPLGTITKNVPVHCIEYTNVAQWWKNQIDRGASPDFSHKKITKTVSMQLPESCSE